MGPKIQVVEKVVTGMTKAEFILTASVLFMVFMMGLAICVWLLKQWLKPLENIPSELAEIKAKVKSDTEIELTIKDHIHQHERDCLLKKLGILVISSALLLLTGCASYTIRDSTGAIISQGEATGFLRTITVIEKYGDDGVTVIERKISTESTTKDVLLGLNEFIDSAVNTMGKINP